MISVPQAPSFRLDKKRALITGGSRGIGFACATALAQAGAHVTLIARSENQLKGAVEALRKQNLKADYQVFDLIKPETCTKWLATQEPFDILVNNAGINFPKILVEMEDELLEKIINVNIVAVLKLTRQWSKIMIKNEKSGVVINISSQFGKVGAAGRVVYSASKHAIEGLTKSLAWELGQHKIRVNNICPTFILTDITKKALQQPDFKKNVVDKIALGRVGEASDIMGATVFLASSASSLITGSSILIDGGWTAQ